MFAKLSTAFALLAVAAQVAVATPPACLIAAVNTQPDPADLKSVCGDGANQVQSYLSKNCGNNLNAANSAFAETCKSAGVTISTSIMSSASASKTASSTGKGSSSGKEGQSMTDHAKPTGTAGSGYAAGTASSGFMTATANGTYSAPTSSAGSGSGSGSGSGAGGSATSTAPAGSSESGVQGSTGGAARLGMDVVGLAAVGVFGAVLVL